MFFGTVGPIDGLFIKTKAPSRKEVGNVRSYFSGHYESYGLNCQAVCDSNLKFMFFGVIAPGSCNDNIAVSRCKELTRSLKSMDDDLFFVGDAAYTLSDNLLIPFTGSQKDVEKHDSFNFYLSQMRIRIEMAFGLLQNRFRALKTPLQRSLKNNSEIIMACAMLHNFIIDEDIRMNQANLNNNVNGSNVEMLVNIDDLPDVDGVDMVPNPSSPLDMVYTPCMLEEDYEQMEGVSYTREALVEYLFENGYKRPLYNLRRNREEENMTVVQETLDGYVYGNEFYHPD